MMICRVAVCALVLCSCSMQVSVLGRYDERSYREETVDEARVGVLPHTPASGEIGELISCALVFPEAFRHRIDADVEKYMRFSGSRARPMGVVNVVEVVLSPSLNLEDAWLFVHRRRRAERGGVQFWNSVPIRFPAHVKPFEVLEEPEVILEEIQPSSDLRPEVTIRLVESELVVDYFSEKTAYFERRAMPIQARAFWISTQGRRGLYLEIVELYNHVNDTLERKFQASTRLPRLQQDESCIFVRATIFREIQNQKSTFETAALEFCPPYTRGRVVVDETPSVDRWWMGKGSGVP